MNYKINILYPDSHIAYVTFSMEPSPECIDYTYHKES